MSDTTRIHELNSRRASLARAVEIAGMRNIYGLTENERLAADASYRMTYDAWLRAEREYASELDRLDSDTLTALATTPVTR